MNQFFYMTKQPVKGSTKIATSPYQKNSTWALNSETGSKSGDKRSPSWFASGPGAKCWVRWVGWLNINLYHLTSLIQSWYMMIPSANKKGDGTPNNPSDSAWTLVIFHVFHVFSRMNISWFHTLLCPRVELWTTGFLRNSFDSSPETMVVQHSWIFEHDLLAPGILQMFNVNVSCLLAFLFFPPLELIRCGKFALGWSYRNLLGNRSFKQSSKPL